MVMGILMVKKVCIDTVSTKYGYVLRWAAIQILVGCPEQGTA